MTQALLFLRGLAIGFALAAPVGPVGILCIRRALAQGLSAALIAGLGAALADTIFGAVAGLGLTMISGFVLDHQTVIRLVGGGFLIIVAVRGWHDPDCARAERFKGGGLLKDFLSTFLMSLANPATILAAVGVFAALGAIGLNDAGAAGILIAGVFFGSTLWWLILSAAAGAVRSRFSPARLTLLNRGSSALIGLIGTTILGTVAVNYFFK